jgi:hypothetical protein
VVAPQTIHDANHLQCEHVLAQVVALWKWKRENTQSNQDKQIKTKQIQLKQSTNDSKQKIQTIKSKTKKNQNKTNTIKTNKSKQSIKSINYPHP